MERSPLGRLPQELRDRIYELVLVAKGPIRLYWSDWDGKYRLATQYPDQAPQNMSLLRTCKDIHDEALAVFLGSNTFALSTRISEAKLKLQKFLRDAVTARRAHILRRVQLDIDQIWTSELQPLETFLDFFNSVLSCEGRPPKCRITLVGIIWCKRGFDDPRFEIELVSKSARIRSIRKCAQDVDQAIRFYDEAKVPSTPLTEVTERVSYSSRPMGGNVRISLEKARDLFTEFARHLPLPEQEQEHA